MEQRHQPLHSQYIHEQGDDLPEIRDWRWQPSSDPIHLTATAPGSTALPSNPRRDSDRYTRRLANATAPGPS